MTYEDLLRIIQAGNVYNAGPTEPGTLGDFSAAPGYGATTFLQDPNDPMAGSVSRNPDGSLFYQSAVPTGGINYSAFNPQGQLVDTGFRQNTAGWQDSLRNAVLTLGGSALGANLLGPLAAGGVSVGAPAGTGLLDAASIAAIDGVAPASLAAGSANLAPGIVGGAELAATYGAGGAPAAVTAGGVGAGALGASGGVGAGMGGAEEVAAMQAAARGMQGAAGAAAGLPAAGLNWGSLLSGLTSGPGLAAGLGALAGIAGNDNMQIGSTGTSNATTSGTTQGSTSANTNSTGSQSLAPWLQGFAQDYVGRAQALAGAPTSNATMDQGRGLLSRLASGDPLINAARQQQQNVISGGMLGSNPYINQVASDAARIMGEGYATGTRAGTFSNFNNDGNSVRAKSAFGQTLGQQDEAFTRGLGSTITGLLSGNYQQERAAQDNASRASLGFGQFDAGVGQSLYGLGAQDWQRPYFQNQQFGAAINPAFGSQTQNATNALGNSWQNVLQNQQGATSQTQNIQAPNNWMAGLGGAAMGAGIYRSLFPTTR